jgi:redox-sensitive bicupin YhaK (pirin superfamily)
MITVRKSEERGHADHGWLDTYHTFSFASYFDPQHLKYRALRVLNEDWIHAHKGFGSHPRENMEIITYVIDGELEHSDSMGNGSVIHRGELQRITAGTGITYNEFNPSEKDTHLLQIWISPERASLKPEYERHNFIRHKRPNRLTLLASQTGEHRSLTVHQDMELYGGRLDSGKVLHHAIDRDRHAWVQVVNGTVDVNGTILHEGDGAAVDDEQELIIAADQASEFLLFDLA